MPWTAKASMPNVRHNGAVGIIGSKVYLAGGKNSAGADQTPLWEYDVTTNTWNTSLNGLPAARTACRGAVIGTKFYVLGGPTVPTNSNYEYDQAAGTWTTRTLPETNENVHAGAIGANIIFGGGGSLGKPIKLWKSNSIPSSTWTAQAAAPAGRRQAAGAVIGTKFYVAGGMDGGTAQSTLFEWDSVANTWATKTAMPAARYNVSAASIGTKLYVVGGDNSSGVTTNTLFVWDQGTDTWTTHADTLPTARADHHLVSSGTSLLMFGGRTGSTDATSTDAVHEWSDVTSFAAFGIPL